MMMIIILILRKYTLYTCVYIYIYTHTYIHAYIHTYIRTYDGPTRARICCLASLYATLDLTRMYVVDQRRMYVYIYIYIERERDIIIIDIYI